MPLAVLACRMSICLCRQACPSIWTPSGLIAQKKEPYQSFSDLVRFPPAGIFRIFGTASFLLLFRHIYNKKVPEYDWPSGHSIPDTLFTKFTACTMTAGKPMHIRDVQKSIYSFTIPLYSGVVKSFILHSVLKSK